MHGWSFAWLLYMFINAKIQFHPLTFFLALIIAVITRMHAYEYNINTCTFNQTKYAQFY